MGDNRKDEIAETSSRDRLGGWHRRVAGVSLRDRVKSSAIHVELRLDPLLLCLEGSQLRWFGHLVRMSTERLPKEVFEAGPMGRRPRGRPRTRWRLCTDLYSPIRAGQCGPGKGSLGLPARAAAPGTRTRISGFEVEMR